MAATESEDIDRRLKDMSVVAGGKLLGLLHTGAAVIAVREDPDADPGVSV